MIKTTGDQSNLIGGSGSAAKSNNNVVLKKQVTQGKIEETKINFFDPSKYEEEEKMFERAEENMMIEARFDPLEWRQEVDAVYKDLANIQKDIDLAK